MEFFTTKSYTKTFKKKVKSNYAKKKKATFASPIF